MRNLLPPPPASGMKIKPWLVQLYYYCRSLEISGDNRHLFAHESPTGTVLRLRREDGQDPGSSAAAEASFHDGGSVSGTYTADYRDGDIHRITASGTLAVNATYIPLGCALLLRIDNTAGVEVSRGGVPLIESTERGSYVLTFANLTGYINVYTRLYEV